MDNDMNHVTARLLDYFGRRTPWQRRLWNPGALLAIKEVVEAIDVAKQGYLHPAAVKDFAATAKTKVGRDPGMGPSDVRSRIQRCLNDVERNGLSARELGYLADRIGGTYLTNWRDSLARATPEPEFLSRALASHLLDSGFSPEHLHRWLTAITKGRTQSISPSDLVEAADDLAQRSGSMYQVMIPVVSVPKRGIILPPTWREARDVSAWLVENGTDHKGVRHNGGFLFTIEARDPWAAVEQASDMIESFRARVIVGLPGTAEFRPLTSAWVSNRPTAFKLDRPRRQVDVHSLTQTDAIFSTFREEALDPSVNGPLRSALDLLAPLESSAPGAAVAGGWAAIEVLLTEPGAPNVVAADNLAVLVACSFPRAELTTLAYRYADTFRDDLSREIQNCETNRERCELLAKLLKTGNPPHFADPSDDAAVTRMIELLMDPAATLKRVRQYAQEAFRRLYRQRNLALHAGKQDSVALTATLRSAPPLVGAGIDRIAHASIALGVEPLDLVARGRAELSLAGKNGGRAIVDLLEGP